MTETILKNIEKIKKCLSTANEMYFELCPPKKPFFSFESDASYRERVMSERENQLFSRLNELINPSGKISFERLWGEFGLHENDDLLLKWIKILSTFPELAETEFNNLRSGTYGAIFGMMQSQFEQSRFGPDVRITRKPFTKRIVNEFHKYNFYIWYD